MKLKKLMCYLLGHSWKEFIAAAKASETNNRYLYVANYIKLQIEDTVSVHQCKRCNEYILKNESPEYC